MMKKVSRHNRKSDRVTMRPEYDFSAAVRGATAARYAQGANIVVIDPEVLDVFPDGATVNRTPRALAPVLRLQHRRAPKRSAPDEPPRATAKSAARLSGMSLAARHASRHGCDLASRISEANGVVATVILPLIDRGFVLHRKAHGQKGTVRGYPLLATLLVCRAPPRWSPGSVIGRI
jgi:hypothetical protein